MTWTGSVFRSSPAAARRCRHDRRRDGPPPRDPLQRRRRREPGDARAGGPSGGGWRTRRARSCRCSKALSTLCGSSLLAGSATPCLGSSARPRRRCCIDGAPRGRAPADAIARTALIGLRSKSSRRARPPRRGLRAPVRALARLRCSAAHNSATGHSASPSTAAARVAVAPEPRNQIRVSAARMRRITDDGTQRSS